MCLGCGDGIVSSSLGELCDHSGSVTAANFTGLCEYGEPECVLCDPTCVAVDGNITWCGDGIVTLPYEECDYAACEGTCMVRPVPVPLTAFPA